MDSQVQGVIALVRAALTGERQPLPADFDLEKAYEPIIQHNIAVMALEGAYLCGLDKKLPAMQKLFMRAFRDIRRVEVQDKAAAALFSAFEQAGIEFMPVKGALLRGLYPKREYRSMGDMDVLIRLEQYEKVKGLLAELGYTGGKETDHELNWYSDAMMLELHKHLIPSCNKKYYGYFGTGWDLARATGSSRFSLSDEDHYLYVFVHFAKHYREGGVGIRQMCDLWLMKQAQPGLDEAHIRSALKKLDLLEFYQNILRTLECWFADAQPNEKNSFISDVIFRSGAFGQEFERTMALGARISGQKEAGTLVRYQNAMRRLFMAPGDMKIKYPVLQKWMILLPVMWIYRIISIAILEPQKIKKETRRFRMLEQESVSAYQRTLDFVGLKYDDE